MNNVQLIGRLTKDVDLRYFQNAQGDQAVARFIVAVDRMPKQDGTHETDFITCSCFGRRAEVIADHFQKGSKIGLVGRIRTGSYVNQQGATVYTTEVEVTDIDFIDPKSAQQPNPTTPQYNMQQGQQYYQNQQQVPQQAAVPQQPAQQPAQQRSQKGRTASTRAASSKSSARSAAPVQPTPARMNQQPVQPQEEFVDYSQIPQVDEGLPFN